MSSRKDMRRADLIIPYQTPTAKESPGDISGTLGSTLPMAAMFTRNRFIGWASLALAIQNWLGESQEAKRTASQPAYFSVGMGKHVRAVDAGLSELEKLESVRPEWKDTTLQNALASGRLACMVFSLSLTIDRSQERGLVGFVSYE
ncbi:hypothetical protein MBM_00638 [Drepanopeziza brunnea f. sp. 'multigermtubi' MB_m1]|uniref:Uncharacterized protein n=1 Tax=Marssonina brunnea f. sp. multigermtubi (strain MB_m1) TaxID=1072389 RepID=K1WV54_MARBU|nr:uncharacterized protein MBM_00638 [Drepanopeziza brunnea f. sp. 'multigermtubi' MB_m1]EKD21525.1 hypothetical protein MBM_00638 [Drepanopeziza brunnea f. sp. 'multigermtubi' MB_m1]